jgi:hypothetical protein
MTTARKYELLNDRVLQGQLCATAGTIVYVASGWDYGLASDDEYATGHPHTSVTLNADGSLPSFTVPDYDLGDIGGPDHEDGLEFGHDAGARFGYDLSVRMTEPGNPNHLYPTKVMNLMGQWQVDGTVEGFEINGMLVVPQPEGCVYVTRQQAKEFFGLVEPK